MKLSRESAYGIEGLLALAANPPGTVMLLSDIATTRGVPQSFLAKIFQKLTRHGIVRSFRGSIRGYALALPPTAIKLEEILIAIEGPEIFERCIFRSERCVEITPCPLDDQQRGQMHPCPLHDQWKQIRQQLIGEMMKLTTLANLLEGSFTGSDVVTPFLVNT